MAQGRVESWYWGLGFFVYPSFYSSVVVQVRIHFVPYHSTFYHCRGIFAIFYSCVKSFYVLLGRFGDVSQSPAVLSTDDSGSWIVVDRACPLFMVMQDCPHLPVSICGLDCFPWFSHGPSLEKRGLVRGGHIFLKQGRTQKFHLLLVWVLPSIPCHRRLPYIPHWAIGLLHGFFLAHVHGQDCFQQVPYFAAAGFTNFLYHWKFRIMDQARAMAIMTMIQKMKATQWEVWNGLVKSRLVGLNSDMVLIESRVSTSFIILSTVLSAKSRWELYFFRSFWRLVRFRFFGSWDSSRPSRLSRSLIIFSPLSDPGSEMMRVFWAGFRIFSSEVS